MKKNIIPLLPDSYYHVYNRSINRESLFKSEANYLYFLEKMKQHINPVAKIFGYCLLQNHFHFLVQIKSEFEIRSNLHHDKYLNKKIEFVISKQFSNLFNSYAQALNKMHHRTGGLFEEPFRRKEITSDEYLTAALLYIHLNPLKHKLRCDFKEYPYSSYSSILQNKNRHIDSETVIRWFGNIEDYIRIHEMNKIKYL